MYVTYKESFILPSLYICVDVVRVEISAGLNWGYFSPYSNDTIQNFQANTDETPS